MAEEEAIRVLFTNIGESEYNIVSELILENFGDTIDLDSTEAVESLDKSGNDRYSRPL